MCLALASASYLFFFFNDPAPTEIYTLSLHDALPICDVSVVDLVTEKEVEKVHVGAHPRGMDITADGKTEIGRAHV